MKRADKGFTLIEVIVTLVLVGIMAVGIGNTLVLEVQGYLFARDAESSSQKAQLALARIKREIIDLTAITATTDSSTMTYTNTRGTFRIQKNGSVINLQDTTVGTDRLLLDNMSTNYGSESFLTYLKADGSSWVYTDSLSDLYAVRVLIIMNGFSGSNDLWFETTVTPRNNAVPNAPILNE
ncbi:MAG: prepilin-type N-terminal cleavage/methylation domain-containing protein [Deltaproteobacteria bacterium]|nr:prepilin-type N-terminal cleavage/methylation domain-containing protein [Deltaproteobacteria bacterium]